MKTLNISTLAITALLSASAAAQGFDAGSTGALEDAVFTANTTVTLPEDGKLHFRSLRVEAGVRVNFQKNIRNTPVFILSQGDIVIDGIIDVNGFAASAANPTGGVPGPGGFGGGHPGFGPESPPGWGFGPGGGRAGDPGCSSDSSAGCGSYGSRPGRANSGAIYGSPLLIPMVGGSGGGGAAGQPGLGGGGGAGAMLLASNTRITMNGSLQAIGGGSTTCINGGSGGAIRLVAPTVEGGGSINVTGPGNAGAGRIRVDTINRSNLRFTFQDANVTTVGGNLITFPPVTPQLDTIEVAGNAVPVGSGPATFTLPFGSTPLRTVRVRASGFGRIVPIRVTLTPDSGNPSTFDATVDNTVDEPAIQTVDVTLPVNTLVTVHCWTR